MRLVDDIEHLVRALHGERDEARVLDDEDLLWRMRLVSAYRQAQARAPTLFGSWQTAAWFCETWTMTSPLCENIVSVTTGGGQICGKVKSTRRTHSYRCLGSHAPTTSRRGRRGSDHSGGGSWARLCAHFSRAVGHNARQALTRACRARCCPA
jgi:hypothetical protein